MNNKNDNASDFSNLKVAVVHEWLVDYSGSERVVEQMLELFPQADLFALVDFLPDNLRWFIKNKPVTTSFIQKLPGAQTRYRNFLPLMPLAIEQFDLSGYDLILSSNHAVSKGVITGANQLHICYCHSPIRYAWDLTHQYLRESGLTKGFKSWLVRYFLHRIRIWDNRTANGVDHFIANSNFIARRIKKVYGRDSDVIYPPVEIDKFTLMEKKEDFFFTVSRMVPYKKINVIVEAFSAMTNKKLIVAGDGPDFKKIKALAGPNVEFIGFQPTEVIVAYMQKAKAFVFAAEEDFGIVPVEAQACGTPVIAYGRGGVLETVIPGITGLFFEEQTSQSLQEAVIRFERHRHDFNASMIRANALQFAVEKFREAFRSFVTAKLNDYKNMRPMPKCDNGVSGKSLIYRKNKKSIPLET